MQETTCQLNYALSSCSEYWEFSLLLTILANFILVESGREDYDLDNDGLIEINDLADLNEIHNNLEEACLYGVQSGCPEDACIGFELTTDLDFDSNSESVKVDTTQLASGDLEYTT